jgi:hypothetical protein
MDKATRVIGYIDGHNLYFGLKEKARKVGDDGKVFCNEWKNFYWLDVVRLSEPLLQTGQTLVLTKYFTSRIRANRDKEIRQSKFIGALSTLPNLRKTFKKRVLFAFPPKRESAELQAVATATCRIGKSKFMKSLLPRKVLLPSGAEVECPREWIVSP